MFVYAIKSEYSGKIYIGHTKDLEKRLKRHNGILPKKSSSFTSKNIGPWVIVHKEEYSDRNSAIKREKEIKSAKGRKFIRKIIDTPC